MSGAVPSPVVFGTPRGPLFGFHHAPPDDASRRVTGLVLCNPLGYDAMCTHRTYRHLAERAAEAGFPALRFDYEGTGDSFGRADEPHRLRAWLDGIGAAIDALRARSGVARIALLGVRFGATLAALAACERGDVDALVLWGPAPSGRAYVRELRAFRMLKMKEAPRLRVDGDEEVAGYLFDKETVADMSAVDLFARTERSARRALIVPREFASGEERLAAHLGARGASVAIAQSSGYAQMMRDAQDTVVPIETLDEILAWLSEGEGDAEGAPCAAPPTVGGAVHLAPQAVLGVAAQSGAPVREAAIAFGEGDRLFGIVSEPVARPPRADAPVLLFLNVGANHHVGPNRMYVTMGRDLAALGYTCVRFDVGGLGESRSAPGARENRLYSKDSVGDVKAAMDYLEQARGARRFVLTGLCSGAYLAFHTAIEDPRVVGQVLLNPQTFEWKEGDSLELSMRKSYLSTRYYARALFNPSTWTRLARGEIDVSGVTGALRERLAAYARGRASGVRARILGRTEPQSEIERAFSSMSDRGVASLLVFSFEDGGLDMIERHLGRNGRKMARRKNFAFEIVDGADHTFTPLASQRALDGIITRYITRSFA